ncbi:MAG TPA: NAD(P)/FAD-dependent oxidoreductase [Aestuariivirgaceae bacterium]|nr:NAD(P)/FAD-dependent oxidoreductase [Aestuariivirgaceae bacterium]
MAEQSFDVVVVGAGFAGAAAASVLQKAGYRTAVLEARDRAGGRAYTRAFVNSSDVLEFGGAWIAPGHERVRHYASACDFFLRPTAPVVARRWHDGSTLRDDAPAPAGDLQAYDEGLQRIIADARRYAQGTPADQPGFGVTGMSMSSYLHRLNANRALRSQAMAWWCISGNGDPNRISADEFISSCAHGDGSPDGMMKSLAHTIVSGAGDLVRRMIERSGANLQLRAEVESIMQLRSDVVAQCRNGEAYRAKAAVVALPLNVLKDVRFAPAIGRRKNEAVTQGHGGRAFKLWIKAEGPAVGSLVTGGLDGLQWAFVDRQTAGGSVMIVAFGLMDGKFDPASPGDVERGVKKLFPEARLIAWDWHDWLSDPHSRGTWLALPAEASWIGDSAEWRQEDKVFFASADFAPGTPGWFESAIISGETAAREIIGMSL